MKQPIKDYEICMRFKWKQVNHTSYHSELVPLQTSTIKNMFNILSALFRFYTLCNNSASSYVTIVPVICLETYYFNAM